MILLTIDELNDAWERAILSAESTHREIAAKLSDGDVPSISHALKFEQIAFDPLDPNRPLNLIEHINQLFTALVSFAAARHLMSTYSDIGPITLNIGAKAGYDIEARKGAIRAECFAAVNPRNNKKLSKDIQRLREATAETKLLYYYSPMSSPSILAPEDAITVILLRRDQLYPEK
jgi:hypothetical protein